jgi:hypothetical protein
VTKQFESYCNYPIFVQKKMSRRMTCCARLSEDEKAVRRPDKVPSVGGTSYMI